MKTFSDINMRKEFITKTLILQEMLNEADQSKVKSYRSKSRSTQRDEAHQNGSYLGKYTKYF